MDSGLTSWLEDSVGTQIQLGVKWLQERIQHKLDGIKPDPSWLGLYEDSGSCLEILDDIGPGTRSTLQIIGTSPLTVSDGAFHIRASLSSECAQDLSARYHGVRLTEGGVYLHSLIAVRRYSIRCTSYGPPSGKLDFILHSIEWQRGPHTQIVGHPTTIVSCAHVETGIAKLEHTRDKEDQKFATQRQFADMPPPGPADYGREHPMPDNSLEDSQMDFATQIPQPRKGKASVPPGGISPSGDNIEGGHLGSPVRKDNTHSSLLGLIKGPGLTDELQLSSPLQRARMIELSRFRAANPDFPASPKYKVVQKPTWEDPEYNVSPHDVSSIRQANIDGEYELAKAQRKKAAVKRLTPKALGKPVFEVSTEQDTHSSPAEWMLGWHFDAKSAKVNQDQQELLSRTDSWQKPPPGHRFPDGSIPINTYKEISAMVEAGAPTNGPEKEIDSEDDISARIVTDDGLEVSADGPLSAQEEILEDEQATSVLSWSPTPSPRFARVQSRLDRGLPPDSSFEAEQRARTQVPTNDAPASSKPTDLIESHSTGEGTGDLPSSPPVPVPDDSDDEMELETGIPQGLGEDRLSKAASSGSKTNLASISAPALPQSRSVVQVEVTPYAKAKDKRPITGPNPSSPQRQTSSGTSNNTSSTSIVYGTYNQPASSNGSRVGVTAKPSNRQRETDDFAVTAKPMNRQKHVHFPTDQDAAQSSPTSVSQKNNQFENTTKRKSDTSPSRIDPRRAKRREIKVMGFDEPLVPSQDTEFDLSREKKESVQRIREERKLSAGTDPLEDGAPMDLDQPQEVADTKVTDEAHEEGRLVTSFQDLGMENVCLPSAQVPATSIASHATTNGQQLETRQIQSVAISGVSKLDDPVTRSDNGSSLSVPNSRQASEAEPRKQHVVGNRTPGSAQAHAPAEGFTASVFDEFKSAYPEYSGNMKHFLGLCLQMNDLDEDDKMVPKWMWDDYLIRNGIDYKEYFMNCNEAGEQASLYHRFYKDHIRNTIYNKGVLKDASTLRRALRELANPRGQQQSRRTLPWAANDGASSPYGGTPGTPISGHSGHGGRPALVDRDEMDTPLRKNREHPPNRTPRTDPKAINRSSSMTNARINQKPTRVSLPSIHTKDPRHLSDDTSKSTGNAFRDWYLAQQKLTSFTGSKAERKNEKWPNNVLGRLAPPDRKPADILSWKDEL